MTIPSLPLDILANILYQITHFHSIDQRNTLFACLRVNWKWCYNVVPLLWRNPFGLMCYAGLTRESRTQHSSLITTILFCFDQKKRNELAQQLRIQLPPPDSPPLFDYPSYIQHVNPRKIHDSFKLFIDLAKSVPKKNLNCIPFLDILLTRIKEVRHLHIIYLPWANSELRKVVQMLIKHKHSKVQFIHFFGNPSGDITPDVRQALKELLDVQTNLQEVYITELLVDDQILTALSTQRKKINFLGFYSCNFSSCRNPKLAMNLFDNVSHVVASFCSGICSACIHHLVTTKQSSFQVRDNGFSFHDYHP